MKPGDIVKPVYPHASENRFLCVECFNGIGTFQRIVRPKKKWWQLRTPRPRLNHMFREHKNYFVVCEGETL